MTQDKIDAYRDVVMEGHVSHVGTTSMEVTIRLMQQPETGEHWHSMLTAHFVMVAKDPHSPKYAS